jgi:hypothetical protein
MTTLRRSGFSIQNNKPDIEYERTIDDMNHNDLDYNPTQIKRKKSIYNNDNDNNNNYRQPYYICFLYYITLPFAYIYAFKYTKKKTTPE